MRSPLGWQRKSRPPLRGRAASLVIGVTHIGDHLRAQGPKATAPKKRGPLSFKQRDLTRAVKGLREAGSVPARVEIIDPKGGKIVLYLNDNEPAESSVAEDWDNALSNDR